MPPTSPAWPGSGPPTGCIGGGTLAKSNTDIVKAELREAAHQAVKAFDRQPNWDNTCLAILALEEFQDALRRERNG